MNDEKALIGKRSQLYRKLFKIRNILPGSLSMRKLPCGKPQCICKREGKLHDGYQYSFKLGPEKKGITKMIPKDFRNQVEKQVLENKEFKKIMKRIQEINVEILFNRLKSRKKK